MYLIAGLGNPGPLYRKNRHNVGFMLVDRMAEQAGKRFRRVYPGSLTCLVERAGRPVLLAKPQGWMNLSGEAIREIVHRHPLELSQVLIVYDEVALPLGKIRLRRSGSAGGQKGMQSILEALSSQDIPRLRIGVGREDVPEDYSGFVLSNFDKEETKILDEVLDRALQAIDTLLSEGLDRAMAMYN